MPKDELFADMSEDQLLDVFCEIFYHELDSWFSADIACCDVCYDEFLEKWPAIYSRDIEFQKSAIDLSTFYNGSRLEEIFTEEEFNRLIKEINCPRCGSQLYANIWPYNMCFELPDDFEDILDEIGELANKTPFLILSHTFAMDVYKEIKKIGETAKKSPLNGTYYRARRYEKNIDYEESDFSHPPKSKTKEGRYNHAGKPVIYLGDQVETCFCELRKPQEGLAVAEISIKNELKVLDLIENSLVEKSVLNTIVWSSLMSSPVEGEGWYKPHYIFTRFVADCAIDAGFDAIKYPSVRFGEGYNLVLLESQTICNDVSISKPFIYYDGKQKIVDLINKPTSL
ncbi:MAG: RES domain-containing protein [Firmicutes bacterium]|nr:RES domain-containing protein [Bacillota bacterium]